MYGAQLADIYDLIHAHRGKDFSAEAEFVADEVRKRLPTADRLLDVACGTGSHLVYFGELFTEVVGLEMSEPMLRRAQAAMPRTALHQGDMRDFDLRRDFDAITCMFGSMGYMRGTDELTAALTAMARHLVPGGVLAVDPWWFAETFTDGHVSADIIDVNGTSIARVSHSARDGNTSDMQVHYIVADHSGAQHFVEQHRISLFSRAEYEQAFTAAGLRVTYIEGVQSGRGLFVGVGATRS